MRETMRNRLEWQSKLVLLAVAPAAAVDLFLQTHWWVAQMPAVAVSVLGTGLLLGLTTWKLRAATPWASAVGVAVIASLMYSTVSWPYQPWRTALLPAVLVAALAHGATRLGRARKERLGLGEGKRGRTAAQIAANLGVAMLAAQPFLQDLLREAGRFSSAQLPMPLFSVALAALAEAAADTVSSEIGQAFGGVPRLVPNLRRVAPGVNGAVSLPGTAAGVAAAALVAAVGAWSLGGGRAGFLIALGGGVFGLFFDSLLGATIEDRGWLNNNAVNFLSTVAAAAFALLLLRLV